MKNFPKKRTSLQALVNALFAAMIAVVLFFGAIRYMIAEIWGAGQTLQSLLWEVLPAVAALLLAWILFSALLKKRVFSPAKELKQAVQALSGEIAEGKKTERAPTSRELQEVRDELSRQSEELLSLMKYSQNKVVEEIALRERTNFARRIYREASPDSLTLSGNGYFLDARLCRAAGLSYDFIDGFLLDEHTVFFAVGDVWGQGLDAALFLMKLKSELRAEILSGKLLARAMVDLNAVLYKENASSFGASLFAGVFNSATRELHFVNMGQFAPVTLGNFPDFLHVRTGIPLGLYETVTVYEQNMFLSPGQGLVFCTEGVMSAAGERDKTYGFRKIPAIANLFAKGDKAAEEILKAVGAHADGEDDCAVLVLRCEAAAERGNAEREQNDYRNLLLRPGSGS